MSSFIETDNQNEWGSRNIVMAAMLSQTLGVDTLLLLTQRALVYGAAGHILLYTLIFIILGIPLLYMEYVTGQFTGRDCIDVWKIRHFLSHVGYVQIFCQTQTIIFQHTISSFVLHYFLISFENPIPYYICGPWSNTECNILKYNYTIHQDCLTPVHRRSYCKILCRTFPEYQYWRYFIAGFKSTSFHLAWRITIASGLICIVLFLSCFKRIRSVKWFLVFYSIYLIVTSLLLLTGSMLQKGIVVKFEGALDVDFTIFSTHLHFPSSVLSVLLSLNVGSGLSFNVASKSSFRSPCYSNTVIVAVISGAITIFGTCSMAMMLCPYAFKYGIDPLVVAKYPISTTFELIPRLLYNYDYKSFWLILTYSILVICFLIDNTIHLINLIELLMKRSTKMKTYPGTSATVLIGLLYITTVPLMGNMVLLFMLDFQRGVNFLKVFLILLESFFFLVSYGLGRFSEDVHFMLGVNPNAFVKISWIVSIFILIYVFCVELFEIVQMRDYSIGAAAGCWLMVVVITLTIITAVCKILKAVYKKKWREAIGIEPSWGPKCEILQRSRAMFTTHAMTKEYIYRQYHLQAGIVMRQRRCNIRN